MIIGIGIDIVNIKRIEDLIEKQGERFIARVFTDHERTTSEKHKGDKGAFARYFAKRFAAKEAAAKALGTGFRDGVYLKDISVRNDTLGKPYIEFSGGALKFLEEITPKDKSIAAHISLSDDPPMATAYVILEAV